MTDRRGFLGLAMAALVARPATGAGLMTGQMTAAGELEWSYLADTVMGGVSTGQARMEGGALRLTGTVSTANNGGFIQSRTAFEDGLPAGAQGLLIRVRGNGQRYFIHLRTRSTRLPWQYYQAGFDTGAGWQDIRLPFDAFERSGGMLPSRPAPDSVRSVGLVAYGRDHEADVSLAALGVY